MEDKIKEILDEAINQRINAEAKGFSEASIQIALWQMVADIIKEATKLNNQKWVKDIENYQLKPNCFNNTLLSEGTIIIYRDTWQSLKSKMGVEDER